MNKISILALALLPLTAISSELPSVVVGPIDFDEAPVRDAIRLILAGTEVKPEFHLPPAGTLSAKQVKGSLPDVMKKLSDTVGFTYEYKDQTLTIASKTPAKADMTTSAIAEPTATVVKKVEPKPIPNIVIKLKKGDNIHSVLSAAAKANQYTLNWDGDELYSKYDTSFESASFDKSVDSLLIAIKVSGYISGNVIYVVIK